MRREPALLHCHRSQHQGLLAGGRDECQQKDKRKNHNAGRGRLVNQIDEHEGDHNEEGEERLGIVNRGQGQLASLDYRFHQRHEVEHHPQVGGMQRYLAQDFRSAGERDQGVEQARGIADQRYSQPDQSHMSLRFPRLRIHPHPDEVIIVCRGSGPQRNGWRHKGHVTPIQATPREASASSKAALSICNRRPWVPTSSSSSKARKRRSLTAAYCSESWSGRPCAWFQPATTCCGRRTLTA